MSPVEPGVDYQMCLLHLVTLGDHPNWNFKWSTTLTEIISVTHGTWYGLSNMIASLSNTWGSLKYDVSSVFALDQYGLFGWYTKLPTRKRGTL